MKKQKIKDKYEFNRLGNYEMLYPLRGGGTEEQDLMHKYDQLLAISKQIWDESVSGGGYS